MLLRVLDDLWKDHLSTMDHLRHGIHLRGYAQKNPKQEYKREVLHPVPGAAGLDQARHHPRAVPRPGPSRRPGRRGGRLRREAEELAKRMQFQHAEAPSMEQAVAGEEEEPEGPAPVVPLEPVRNEQKIGRNEPCPCGSGKKYKHCHGQLD